MAKYTINRRFLTDKRVTLPLPAEKNGSESSLRAGYSYACHISLQLLTFYKDCYIINNEVILVEEMVL